MNRDKESIVREPPSIVTDKNINISNPKTFLTSHIHISGAYVTSVHIKYTTTLSSPNFHIQQQILPTCIHTVSQHRNSQWHYVNFRVR
jgi:hypothetical protein